MKLWALPDRAQGSPRVVTEEVAKELNAQHWGIFWTPNLFRGPRRSENITKIRYWYVEIDDGDKNLDRYLSISPVRPSMVIESRNGFHMYWRAKDATVENWCAIVKERLQPYYGGDPKCTDMVRLLRVPGYNHCKQDPFPVRVVFELPYTNYRESTMLRLFPVREKNPPTRREAKDLDDSKFWVRVNNIRADEGLLKLSGHWLVKGEHFRLIENSNGKKNIEVFSPQSGRRKTGCFIDSEGKFGNSKGLGIVSWCEWYGWPKAKIADGLRELFPELREAND